MLIRSFVCLARYAGARHNGTTQPRRTQSPVVENANLIAERIVQLGGRAEGTAQAVAGRADGNDHIGALSITLTDFGRHARYASEQANELKDADTADLFTQVARDFDT
jgi:starvation-inducible DNA-binding protein